MLFTYGSISPFRNDGSAVGAVVGAAVAFGEVWFCILVVSGTRVVTGVGGVVFVQFLVLLHFSVQRYWVETEVVVMVPVWYILPPA